MDQNRVNAALLRLLSTYYRDAKKANPLATVIVDRASVSRQLGSKDRSVTIGNINEAFTALERAGYAKTTIAENVIVLCDNIGQA